MERKPQNSIRKESDKKGFAALHKNIFKKRKIVQIVLKMQNFWITVEETWNSLKFEDQNDKFC